MISFRVVNCSVIFKGCGDTVIYDCEIFCFWNLPQKSLAIRKGDYFSPASEKNARKPYRRKFGPHPRKKANFEFKASGRIFSLFKVEPSVDQERVVYLYYNS